MTVNVWKKNQSERLFSPNTPVEERARRDERPDGPPEGRPLFFSLGLNQPLLRESSDPIGHGLESPEPRVSVEQ